jgi:uncharacterized protein YjbI with pentapeptide repeats
MPIKNRDHGDAGPRTRRSGPWRPGAAVAVLAYWALALLLNPLSRLILEGKAVLPLVGLRVSWAVLLLALPAAALMTTALAFVRPNASRPADGRPARRSRSLLRSFALTALFLLLVLNSWNALRLHGQGLTYACGVLLAAGTWTAFWEIPGSGMRGRLLGHRVLRLAIALVLALEIAVILLSATAAERGRYEGIFRYGYLRPFLRPLMASDLSGIDLTSRGKGTSGLGRGLGGPRGAGLQYLRAVAMDARGLNFRLARLGASVLDFANIEGSDFSRADLTQMTFHHAHAAGADFSRALMVGTLCVGSGDFRGARFRRARLDYSGWSGIDARDSDWTGADFNRRPGFLRGSDFRGAIFQGANLADLVLLESNFSGTDFRGASLRSATLWHSVFHDADLEGADLRGTDAEVDQLGRARTLYGALLDPPLAEAIKKKYPRLLEMPEDSSRR